MGLSEHVRLFFVEQGDILTLIIVSSNNHYAEKTEVF
jgi:hypothetical protein